MYPTKSVPIFYDRTHWALTYLKHAGLLIGTRRGFFKITEKGKQILNQNPTKIDDNYLKQFPEFVQFQIGKKEKTKSGSEKNVKDKTPSELLEESYKIINNELGNHLLSQVKSCNSQFFERLVIILLVKMRYGDSIKEAGESIGGKGDEGIDGGVKEDVLGLDVLYIQAKKSTCVIRRVRNSKIVEAL